MELDVKGTGLLRFLIDRGPGKGGVKHAIQTLQVGGAAMTCCGSIFRILFAWLNPQLGSDLMGICIRAHLHMLLSTFKSTDRL